MDRAQTCPECQGEFPSYESLEAHGLAMHGKQHETGDPAAGSRH